MWPLTLTLTLSTSWMHADLESIVCKFGSDPALCLREEAIKVVIWLPVNRLPVKLPVTGFNFQLPVTYLRTFFLHVMQFSASSSSHTHTGEQRQAYIGPRHTGAVRRLGPVGSGLPSIWLSSLLLSPPRAGSPQPGKAGGEEVRTGRPAWMTQT